MRENCTYGSMRGIRRKTAKHVLRVAEGRAGVPPITRGVPLYSTLNEACIMGLVKTGGKPAADSPRRAGIREEGDLV